MSAVCLLSGLFVSRAVCWVLSVIGLFGSCLLAVGCSFVGWLFVGFFFRCHCSCVLIDIICYLFIILENLTNIGNPTATLTNTTTSRVVSAGAGGARVGGAEVAIHRGESQTSKPRTRS